MIDGGAFTNLDMSEAIVKCNEMGFKDEDIIVDVILCFEKVVNIQPWTKDQVSFKNAYDIFERKAEYENFYYYYEDITRIVRGYPKVHFRHLISPL